MFKLLMLSLITCSLLNAEPLKKIETEKNNETNSTAAAPVKKAEEQMKLVTYDVRYDETYSQYSIIKHTKDEYKLLMSDRKIDQAKLKSIFNTSKNYNGLTLSAYGYDYVYERPDLAENFYMLFGEAKNLETMDKVRAADFYLRTNRIDKIPLILKKADCMSSLQNSATCFYYLGIVEFIQTGDNKNTYLRIAKNKVAKAKELYK